jgi:hypothetical protein
MYISMPTLEIQVGRDLNNTRTDGVRRSYTIGHCIEAPRELGRQGGNHG